jgi:lysophospholipase L1-like esterase
LVRPSALGGAPLGQISDLFSPAAELNFVSCSGAVSANVTGLLPPAQRPASYEGGGQYHEVAQLASGYLDQSTDLVFVSLGGNDASFGDVLKFCISKASQCQGDTMPGDTTNLDETERHRITVTVQFAIRDALNRIMAAAPNAKVVVAGYPRLFDGTPADCLDGLGDSEVSWMNEMADMLAERTMGNVQVLAQETGRDLSFVDTREAFHNKGPCTVLSTAINGFKLIKTDGDDTVPSAESFHPNANGTAIYQHTLETALGWP